MRSSPCHSWFFCGSVLLAVSTGCVSFHSYRPVPVLIRDAETKKPIAGAAVKFWYPLGSGSMPPVESSGVSDAEGVAHLRAAPYGEGGIMFAAKAKGFLSEERNISTETITKIEPEHWYKKTQPCPAALVLEMYAEPHPVLELIVPNGYRGLVRVKQRAQEGVPWPAGQRVFVCNVDATGNAEAQLPAAVRQFYPLDVRGKYADGKVLSQDAEPRETGLRWLRGGAGEEVFVIGTKGDLDYMRSLTRSSGGEGRPGRSGGGGQRGGGHHRRGGQSQTRDPDDG